MRIATQWFPGEDYKLIIRTMAFPDHDHAPDRIADYNELRRPFLWCCEEDFVLRRIMHEQAEAHKCYDAQAHRNS